MTEPETLWQELTVHALLGTQRRPFTAPAAPGALGTALQVASGSEGPATAEGRAENEHALLRAASITALHRRAGRLPARCASPLPAACAAESWQRCTPQAAARLQAILSGDFIDLLPEWIALAAHHRRRVPEELLPDLFQQNKALQGLRHTLLPVLGERGLWLAGHNPAWQEFAPYTGETIWLEGKRQERLAFLADLRHTDPQRARELLQSTWNQDSPAEKTAFLKVLAEGLSDADEPFLESVLDDRRKDVRLAAIRLLARLPGSRLVQRMTERARQHLAWKSGLLRSSLEVRLPESCDEAMQRDGVDPKPLPGAKIGEKAWWLAQILSLAPPATWCTLTGRRPHQLLEMIRKHEWEEALYLGWREAACTTQDGEWLEAFLSLERRSKERQQSTGELLLAMPANDQESYLAGWMNEFPPLSYEEPASVCLAACKHPWGPELTESVVNAVGYHIRMGTLQAWRWDRLLSGIAICFNPDLLAPAIAQISKELSKKKETDSAVEKLVTFLQFRLDMIDSFEKEPS